MDRVYDAVRSLCPLGEPKGKGQSTQWYLGLRHSGGGIAVRLEPHYTNGWTETVGDVLRFRVPARHLEEPAEFVTAALHRLGVAR